jgi:hypothetical protein
MVIAGLLPDLPLYGPAVVFEHAAARARDHGISVALVGTSSPTLAGCAYPGLDELDEVTLAKCASDPSTSPSRLGRPPSACSRSTLAAMAVRTASRSHTSTACLWSRFAAAGFRGERREKYVDLLTASSVKVEVKAPRRDDPLVFRVLPARRRPDR